MQTKTPGLILWCGGDEPGSLTVVKMDAEEEDIQEEGGLTQDDLIDVLSLYLF